MADLYNLARQAASKPEFVAQRLAASQQAKSFDDAALEKQSGCSLDDLTHVQIRSGGFPMLRPEPVARSSSKNIIPFAQQLPLPDFVATR
jgi:hypothetical protein